MVSSDTVAQVCIAILVLECITLVVGNQAIRHHTAGILHLTRITALQLRCRTRRVPYTNLVILGILAVRSVCKDEVSESAHATEIA